MSILEYSGGAVMISRAMAERFVKKIDALVETGMMEVGEDQEMYNALCAIAHGMVETKQVETSFGIENILQDTPTPQQCFDFLAEAGFFWDLPTPQTSAAYAQDGMQSATSDEDPSIAMLNEPTGLGDKRTFAGGLDVFFNATPTS